MDARSRDNMRLLCSNLGTDLSFIRCAKPSIMAVFPTPGSPINTGLFFLRRVKICATRSISSNRPITGSSLPFLARSVILREK